MEIVLLSDSPVQGSALEEPGVGGSQYAAINLMRALVRRGHRTTIVSPGVQDAVDHGVDYKNRQTTSLHCSAADILIHFRRVQSYSLIKQIPTRHILWTTDVPHSGFPPVDFSKLYKVICISAFQKRMMLAFYKDLAESSIVVLEHGIMAEEYFTGKVVENLNNKLNELIYCSVPGRGLQYLPRLYHRIAERVPTISLNITSDYSLWGRSEGTEPFRPLFKNLPNVNYYGKVPRKTLVSLQKRAKVMAYPCEYAEGFCISALECIAAGTVPVSSEHGALSETIGDDGILISGCPGQSTYDEAFIESVVRLVTDDDYRIKMALQGISRVYSRNTWDIIAAQFEQFIIN